MTSGDRPVPPRIARLIADLSEKGSSPSEVARQFWAEIDRVGTPLVEPAAPGRSWVTFLWRAGVDDRDLASPVEPVMVMGGPALWWQIPDNVLEPVADSDIRYRSYLVEDDLRGRYVLSAGDPLSDLPPAGTPQAVLRAARFAPDPRNRFPFTLAADPADPVGRTETYSTFALPAATQRTWTQRRAEVRRGTLSCHSLASQVLGNVRRVWIYHPPDPPDGANNDASARPARAATAAPALVMLDGRDWIESVPLLTTLDNLIAEGLIPPVTVVAPEALDTATRYREMTVNPAFTGFLTEELLPWARNRTTLPFDPARIAVHGKSYGALAALSAALARPDVFGTVVSQSGSFWWPGEETGDPELLRAMVSNPQPSHGQAGGLRVSLDIGTLEGTAMLGSHSRMAAVLRKGSYPLREHTFNGGHDINCWISELPAALRWWTQAVGR